MVSSKSASQNNSTVGLVIAAVLCAFLPLDISQLSFVLIGAFAYALLQPIKAKPKSQHLGYAPPAKEPYSARRGSKISNRSPAHGKSCDQTADMCQENAKKSSAAPIAAPVFQSSDFDVQVQELLDKLTPSKDRNEIVQRIVRMVKKSLHTLPQVEVLGFATGDITRGKAFGVAVPGVDIVVNSDLTTLVEKLTGRPGGAEPAAGDMHKIHKSAIRACTDRLVASAGFKFRRSAFKSEDPKVTLLAPLLDGIDDAIPLDFSINSKTPVHHASLLSKCEKIDSRARDLVLLVKRWSKDRGVCFAAKGHLSPYLWSVLVIYYLQVGTEDGAVLPPFDSEVKNEDWSTSNTQSVGQLFKGFLHFYTQVFKWTDELVSIRSAQRQAPSKAFPAHEVSCKSGKTSSNAPFIEDPYDSLGNLGACMNSTSLARLHEELVRAHKLCTSHSTSLVELLELWVPQEEDQDEGKDLKQMHQARPAITREAPKWENSCAPWRRR